MQSNQTTIELTKKIMMPQSPRAFERLPSETHVSPFSLSGLRSKLPARAGGPPNLSESMTIVLMYGAPARIFRKPPRDALSVEPAQALQPRHGDANLELLQTNCALRTINTVLLGCEIREHTRPSGHDTSALTSGSPAVCAVSRDAHIDMCFSQSLRVRQVLSWQLAVAHGTLVLFRELWWVRWQWSSLGGGGRR